MPRQEVRQPKQRIVQGGSPSDSNKTTVSKENQQPSENEAIERLISVIQAQQQQEAQARQSQERQTTQDTEIQRKLAKYTRALVYVGILQAVVLLLTVIVIYMQIATTRGIERAWMVAYVDDLPAQPPQSGLRIACNITNTGHTPAIIMAKAQRRQIENIDYVLPEQWAGYGDRTIRFHDGAVVAPEGIAGTFHNLSPEEAQSVYCGERSLWLHGFVEYKDVFGRRHETRYCLKFYSRMGMRDRPRVGFFPDGPSSYTKAT